MAKNKVKLDSETLKAIWDASRPTVERNKKNILVRINTKKIRIKTDNIYKPIK